MSGPNWLIVLVLGLALSIPVSLLTNLATPRVQNWLDRRAMSNKGKRLKRLEQEYDVKELRDNPSLLYLRVAHHAILSLNLLLLMIGGFIFVELMSFAGGLGAVVRSVVVLLYAVLIAGAMMISNRLQDLSTNLVRLRNFERYEADVTAKIKQIQDSQTDAAGTDTKAKASLPASAALAELVIHSAKYGAQGKTLDVTRLLNSRISAGRLRVLVCNDNLGADPIRGVVKELRVDYSYGSQRHQITVPERETLSLPQE